MLLAVGMIGQTIFKENNMGKIWLQTTDDRLIHLPIVGDDFNSPDDAASESLSESASESLSYSASESESFSESLSESASESTSESFWWKGLRHNLWH